MKPPQPPPVNDLKKTKPGDRDLAANAQADPVDRVGALRRLLADGEIETIRPIVEPLALHPSPILRDAALSYLLIYLELDEYVPVALDRLAQGLTPAVHDEDASILLGATNAAFSLGFYALETGRQKPLVYRALANALEQSDHPSVQRACYEALRRGEGHESPMLQFQFVRERDVNQHFLAEVTSKYLLSSTLTS
jgi:hypothetical protein